MKHYIPVRHGVVHHFSSDLQTALRKKSPKFWVQDGLVPKSKYCRCRLVRDRSVHANSYFKIQVLEDGRTRMI